MPVRVARYRELCQRCRAPTESHCFRCKTPLCTEHGPGAGRRCASCEREFRRWPSREPRVLAIGLLLATLWVGGTLALLEWREIIAVAWALLVPAAVALVARRALVDGREMFLRQEKRFRREPDPRRILI